MDNDFAKLASNESHAKILAGYIQYRIPKASRQQISDILDRCAKKKLTSAGALDELKDIHAHASDRGASRHPPGTYEENRVGARLRDLAPFEKMLEKTEKYLDIGCGNGSITKGIGAHFGVSEENIIGADIPNWAGHDHEQEADAKVNPGFIFKAIRVGSEESPEYSIPVESGSFQLVSFMMVMHHIKTELLQLVFREVLRVLTPGGFVLIREHDSPNEMVDSLINIERGLFEVAIEGLATGNEFSKTYFGKYRTKREWRALFANYGFDHVGTTENHGATRGYYSLFRRGNQSIAPIEAKETPDLIKDARANGVSQELLKIVRNDTDLKNLIVGGRREVIALENQLR